MTPDMPQKQIQATTVYFPSTLHERIAKDAAKRGVTQTAWIIAACRVRLNTKAVLGDVIAAPPETSD